MHAVASLTDSPFPASALDEVGFWRSLGEALRRVEDELRAPGVAVTLAVLKQAKRFVAAAQVGGVLGREREREAGGGGGRSHQRPSHRRRLCDMR